MLTKKNDNGYTDLATLLLVLKINIHSNTSPTFTSHCIKSWYFFIYKNIKLISCFYLIINILKILRVLINTQSKRLTKLKFTKLC